MHLKACITGIINFIGVYVVKYFEEKARKDKLWKIEFTVPTEKTEETTNTLKNISHNYFKVDDKYTHFNCYCETQSKSKFVKQIIQKYNAKYFVTETKYL